MSNICFECNDNPGINCPGRKLNERTRCQDCFNKFMTKLNIEQIKNDLDLILNVLSKSKKVEEVYNYLKSYKNCNYTAWQFYNSLLNY